jgi:hypothetical protein
MFALFFCHWYVSGAVPAATTENVAVCPTVTVWLAGCVVILGPTGAAVTVNVAGLLIALPAELVTITRNVAPLSPETVAGVVYEDDVAPLMFALFFCHWYASGVVPVAVTENVAVRPAVTLWFAGWVENPGAVAFVDVDCFAVPMQPHNTSEKTTRIAAAASPLCLVSIWKFESVLSLILEGGKRLTAMGGW